ncbi:MAG TPA: TonB-dependent receptor [Campylobacterales bacterium]|nr:TonB-dependent receptor [Campylobacterales bacterium]
MLKHTKKIAISLAVSTILTNSLYAQEVTSFEPITVTAQKSEEDVQKVPISLSVFDDISIQDKSISTLADIAKYTPSLLLFNTSQQGLTAPSIRGIYANITSFSTPVSLYVDGVPTMSSLGFENALGDIQRIEVLKGPQGTLYGKNSEAGVINIITRKPDNETRGKIFTTFGSDGKKEIGVNLSGAIIKDKFYMGASFKHNEKDGYIKNTLTNEYVNNKDNDYGKLYLRYTPTDDLDISLITSKSKNNNGAHDWAKAGQDEATISSNLKGSSTPETTMTALKIDYDIDTNTKIKSITTQRKHQDTADIDIDFSPMTIRHLYKDAKFETLSQELRYETQIDNTKVVSGVYLDKTDNDWNTKFLTMADPTGANSKPQKLTSNSIGIFTNVIHPLNDKWTLNTGIRYDKENKEIEIAKANISLDDSWSNISPKLSMQYTIDTNSITYATVAKGYRAGGFSPLANKSSKRSYDQESLISYELGYKAMFLDNTIRFNTSIYYMDIDDMQVEESVVPGITYMVNAATATSKGLEIEFEALVNDEFTLFASGGLNDTSFDKFTDNTGDYKGNTSPFAPKYNFNIGGQYRNGAGYYARVDMNGYGKTYFDKANKYSQDAYKLVNTKVGYETDSFDIYLYANNLFDKQHDATNAYFNGSLTVYKEDREIGVQLAYRF